MNTEMNTPHIDLSTKKVWRNIFEWKGNSYRLQSWKYIYRFSDGSMEFASVSFKDANGVSGAGVAGLIVELEHINWFDGVTCFGDDFIKEKELSNERRILMDTERYNFLKSLPPRLTRKMYEKMVIDRILKDI